MLTFTTNDSQETQQVGYEIGQLTEAGELILLTGELGAGKTCLTQGICRGAGFEGFASSPSFVLVKEYPGRFTIYHIDLYRLESIDEISEMGIEEYVGGDGLCIVEWANKAENLFPIEHLHIQIEHVSPDTRGFQVISNGERYDRFAEHIRVKWNLR